MGVEVKVRIEGSNLVLGQTEIRMGFLPFKKLFLFLKKLFFKPSFLCSFASLNTVHLILSTITTVFRFHSLLPSNIHLRFSLAYFVCWVHFQGLGVLIHSTIFLYSHTLLGISLVCFWMSMSTIFTQTVGSLLRDSAQSWTIIFLHEAHTFSTPPSFALVFSSSLFSWRQQWAFEGKLKKDSYHS